MDDFQMEDGHSASAGALTQEALKRTREVLRQSEDVLRNAQRMLPPDDLDGQVVEEKTPKDE